MQTVPKVLSLKQIFSKIASEFRAQLVLQANPLLPRSSSRKKGGNGREGGMVGMQVNDIVSSVSHNSILKKVGL